MEELLILLILSCFLFLLARELFKLIGQAILNRTIRIALEKSPGQVPALIQKLDRDRGNGRGVAWFVFVAGVLGTIGIFSYDEDYARDELAVFMIGTILLGLFMIIGHWWVTRQARQSDRQVSTSEGANKDTV